MKLKRQKHGIGSRLRAVGRQELQEQGGMPFFSGGRLDSPGGIFEKISFFQRPTW
jgi:hypothetical protein